MIVSFLVMDFHLRYDANYGHFEVIFKGGGTLKQLITSQTIQFLVHSPIFFILHRSK